MTDMIAIARHPRRLSSGVTGAPGVRRDSRAAAPTIEIAPSARASASVSSKAPSAGGIGSIRRAADGTGTDICAAPCAPATLISTRIEPYSISHRLEVKRCGSIGERVASVGNGSILGARAGEACDGGCDLAHVVGVGANLDVGDAGDYGRDVDGDEQVIGAGVAFVEDVGTADVRVGGGCEEEDGEGEDREVAEFIPPVVVVGGWDYHR